MSLIVKHSLSMSIEYVCKLMFADSKLSKTGDHDLGINQLSKLIEYVEHLYTTCSYKVIHVTKNKLHNKNTMQMCI